MFATRFNMIDSRSQLPKNFSLDDLCAQTHTGRSFRVSGSGRDAKYAYRHGIICPLGDIEENLWRELALEQVEAEGAAELYDCFREWQKRTCAWLHTKREVEQYALECFSNRLYQNPQWVDFVAFNAEVE